MILFNRVPFAPSILILSLDLENGYQPLVEPKERGLLIPFLAAAEAIISSNFPFFDCVSFQIQAYAGEDHLPKMS